MAQVDTATVSRRLSRRWSVGEEVEEAAELHAQTDRERAHFMREGQ